MDLIMYILNLDQVSTSEAWREDIALIAADDLTPLDATLDAITVRLQVWARTSRGGGDQSQQFWNLPNQIGNVISFNPEVSAATNDGSGQLTLVNGVLSINIPAATMQQLLPGYHEVGCTIKNVDTTRQLFVGILPLYLGDVFLQ